METRTVMKREEEEQKSQMSHSMQTSSQIRKRTFTSRDEEIPCDDFYPIINAKQLLSTATRSRTWEILQETIVSEEEKQREQWTLFGNETEKIEEDVIRSQHVLRTRADKMAFRKQAKQKASIHMDYLDQMSRKAPDFRVPLRGHAVWEGMTVKLSCTVQGSPAPTITWYKNGELLVMSSQPWNYSLQQSFGLNSLEIRRCCPDDAGEYKVLAKSCLGEATTCGTLVVNSFRGAAADSSRLQTSALLLEEAQFDVSFPPTWVREGTGLTLQCSFTSALLPFQQNIAWLRDGVELHPSSDVEFKTVDNKASLTLKAAQKEDEGVYAARLTTRDGIQERRGFVYVKDAAAAVLQGPASPLAVQVSDVNKDYVFLTWQPPSADGATPVEGYYIERCDLGHGEWLRCNQRVQKTCQFPVFGLKEKTLHQFRVCAVNRAGAGRPSKATEPVLTGDPLEDARTMVVKLDRGRTITVTKDELEGHVKAPFPPTNVHACEVSDVYVVLSWTEPEPRGREPLSFYVEQSLADKSSWSLASLDTVVNSTRFPVFHLVKDQRYRFRVRSVNKYRVSDPSEPSQPVCLGQPRGVPAPPHSVMAIRDTETSVLLQWKEPKDQRGIVGYYLYYSRAGKQEWKTVNNKPVTATRFTVHGLATGKEYVFRVKSVSRDGNSKYSEESEALMVKAAIKLPSSPSGVALLLCADSEMVLGWRAPAFNGGSAVRGYYLDQREKGADTWREVNASPAKERRFKVGHLENGRFYRFRVFAANVAGVGKPSDASEAFLCEKWTMPEPGCPFDVDVREVRDGSLVLVWAAPLYQGQSPVTGFLLEISQADQSDNWISLTDEPVSDKRYKVSGLQVGQTYRFRVSAVNEAGVGGASLPSDAVTVQTKPGTRDIEIDVDDDGFIFLGFEGVDVGDGGRFAWRRNYADAVDAKRTKEETKANRSVLIFTEPSEEDLGLYTVEMEENPHHSSSYEFTAEDLERLKDLSWQIRNPLIKLKSGWQVDVSEEGAVRLWLQTESLSDAAELRLICNDKEISSAPRRQIGFDRSKGLVELLFDRLSSEDEGSYTAQMKDGRARNQFTLVLVDLKFCETLALAEAKRRDKQRKTGPHFQEFLSWSVNEDCELILKCKVTNTNKETSFKLSKDDVEVSRVAYDPSSGIGSFCISQVSLGDSGSYRAVVCDKRGEDVSILNLLGEEYDKLLQQLSKRCALSATPLKIQSTAEGFRLHCSLRYYVDALKTSWLFRERRIDQETRTKPGFDTQSVWIEIPNPTENDKGFYTLEMFDGNETHKRELEITAEVFAETLLEHQKLKQLAFAEQNRAKVTKGLPDVVAIMEEKSLCLTCFVDGDPPPEISWLRNDKEILDQSHFTVSRDSKRSSITVNKVTAEDSGKYGICVRNKHGSETVSVTVSVYKRGEKPPANAVEMG